MADPTLKPVDFDPFAQSAEGPTLVPVEGDPFAGVNVTPVDNDPFDGTEPITDSWLEIGKKVVENAPSMFQQAGAGLAQQFIERPVSTLVPPIPPQYGGQLVDFMAKQYDRLSDRFIDKSGALEWAQGVYTDATADMQENAPNVDPESLKGYAYDAATSLIQMLPAIGATLLTKKPVVGAGIMGAQVGGQKYGEVRAEGKTADQATDASRFFAVAEGIPEMLPLGILMKPGKKFMGRVFSTAGAEGVSEVATAILQTGYDAGVLKEDMTWGEAWDQVKRAGILGAVTGGAAGAIAHPFVKGDAPAPPPASGVSPPAAAPPAPPRAGSGAMPSPPSGAAATTPPAPIEINQRVGLRQADGPPEPVVVEAVQDGYVFFRREDGSQDAAREAEFRRDLTAAPPPSRPQQPDATTVPTPPREGDIPPPDVGDINDFDPDAGQRRAPKTVAPSPQQAMALPETRRIQALRDAASANLVLAAEGERNGQRTPQWVAGMRVEAAKLMDEAAALEAKLTPSRTAPDATAATPEQMAARRLGTLGRAAPVASEATTGPQQFEVTPPKAPPAPAQAALAPVEASEAERPQPMAERPVAPKKPWQERLREQIGQRKASLNDPVAMARNLGTTPEAVKAELQGIASGKNAPIEIIRGQVRKDKKGNPIASPRAGKWRYTPRPTGKAVQSLSDFVYDSGGMAAGSFAGELEARDLHTARRPFKGNLLKPNARMNVEAMADHALQSGFNIPMDATGQHADVDAFLNMLESDHAGSRRTYRPGEEPQVEPGPRPMTLPERKREATRRLTALGFEPKGKTVEELERELDAVLDAVGDAKPIDTMDFAAIELQAVEAMDPEAQEALRQEAKDDYPHEYDEAWFRAEVAEGVSPAQPPADPGVQAGDPASGTVADREGAAASGTEGAAEAASESVQEDEPVWLGQPTGSGISGQQDDLTDQLARDLERNSMSGPKKRREGPLAQRARQLVEDIKNWVIDNGARTGHEYLVGMSSGGRLFWAGTNNIEGGVGLSEDLIEALKTPGTQVNLHHNHPNDGPLSQNDIDILNYPSAGWVVAYGSKGGFSAARWSREFIDVVKNLTEKQKQELFRWAWRNAWVATFAQHRKVHDKLTPDQFEVGEAAWRALHEVGILDYRSNHPVPDYSIPIIDTIRDQIIERLEQHGYNPRTSAERTVRPPVATSADRGLDEIFVRPGERQAPNAIRALPANDDPQGRLLAPERRSADAGSAGVSTTPQTELTDQGEQFVLPGAERTDQQALAARGAQPLMKAKKAQKSAGPLFDTVSDTMARLFNDESGAVPLPDWDKIKSFFGLGKKGTTAEDIALEGVRMNLGAPGSLRSMSRMARYLRMAVSLASIDRPSAVYWNAILSRDHTRATLEREGVEQVKDYLGLDPKARARVDKVLEHDRLYGVDRKATGRDVVVKIPDRAAPFGVGRPELSKPGEIVALDSAETAALHKLRGFFDNRLNLMGEAVARERGYKGAFDRDSIEKAIAEADHPRTRKIAQAALEILDRTEEMRRAGYVPFQRYGDTYITIKPKANADAETAWFEMLDTGSILDSAFSRPGGQPTQALKARLAELQKRFPKDKFDYQVGNVTPKAIADLNIPAIERAFAALNAKQGPGTARIIDDLLHQVYEARKAGLRKQSDNVPGYSTDFERAITDYVRQTSAIVARMSHRQDVDSAYDATQAHPVKRVREYWEKHKLHQEKEGDDYAGLRKLGFFMFLWANPASAIINLTQTPLVTTMQLGTWAGPRAALMAHQGMLEGLRGIRGNKNGLTVDFESLGKTDAEKAMLSELKKEGRFDPAIAEDLGGGAFGFGKNQKARPHLNRLSYVYELGASGFNTTETVNRVAAALAYFRAAQNPQLRDKMRQVYGQDQNFIEMVVRRGMQPIDIARFGVDETQFIGGKLNRMPAMRGIGAVLLQFKTYIANYLRLMHKNFTRMGPQGKIAGSIMLMALLAVSGMFGLPFGDDALKAADFLAEQATGIDPNIEFRTRQFLADSGFGEYGAEVLTRGFGRDVFGVDIGGRIGMGNIFPDDSITSLAPVVTGTLGRLSEATDRAHTGQPLGAAAAIAGVFGGSGAQNLLKGTVVYPNEGVSTRRGNFTVLPDDVTLKDMTIRSLGFQPTNVTRAGEQQYQASRVANATQGARTAMLTQIARLIVAGMDARAAGDTEAARDYAIQVEELYERNAAQLLDPTIPDWQKIKPAARQAVRQRILSLIKPEIANIRRAAKMTRPTLLETPFVEP